MIPAPQQFILERALAVLKGETAFSELDLRIAGHSERLVEVPWAAQFLQAGDHILDIGFSMSSLDWLGLLLHVARQAGTSLQAADIIKPARVVSRYPEEWREQTMKVPVTIGDIRALPMPADHFDLVTCISTIEHIGFDQAELNDPDTAFRRGKTPAEVAQTRDPMVNRDVLAAFHSTLKPGGKVIITTPMGRGGPTLLQDSLGLYTRQWEYEAISWKELRAQPGFEITAEQFFGLGANDQWHEVSSPDELIDKSSEYQPHASGCALLVLQKT